MPRNAVQRRLDYAVTLESLEIRQLFAAYGPGFGLYNPSTARLTLDYNRTGAVNVSHTLGSAGSKVVAADFNGDTLTDTASYLNGNWSIDLNNDGTIDKTVHFGSAAWLPVAGDVTGEGTAALGIYNPTTGIWKFSYHQDGHVDLKFQDQTGGVPVLADFKNTGHDDLILYRSGAWTVKDTNGTLIKAFQLGGSPGDVPIIADFNGIDRVAPGIFNNGIWRFDVNRDGVFDSGYIQGTAGEQPLVGYFDPTNSIFVAPGGNGSGALGSPVGSIKAAVAKAKANSFIRIAAGTYAENVYMNATNNVDFIGAGMDAVHIAPSSGDGLSLDRNGDTWVYNMNIASGDRGLVMLGGNVHLRGLSTVGTVNRGVLGAGYLGVNVNIDAKYCHFDGMTVGDAVRLQNEATLVARGCTFDNNGTGAGIAGDIHSGRGLIVELDCTADVKNCDFSHNNAVGIISDQNTFIRVRQSTVSFNNAFDGAYVVDASRAVFRHNTFQDNGPVRDVANGTNGIEISNQYNGPGLIIEFNTFLDNTSAGVYVGNGTNHIIADNIFNNNPVGININGYVSPALSTLPVNSNPMITGNIFEVPANASGITVGVFALGFDAAGSIGGAGSLENTFENYPSGNSIILTDTGGSPQQNVGAPQTQVLANIYVNSPNPVTRN